MSTGFVFVYKLRVQQDKEKEIRIRLICEYGPWTNPYMLAFHHSCRIVAMPGFSLLSYSGEIKRKGKNTANSSGRWNHDDETVNHGNGESWALEPSNRAIP